ncbi:DMT family transporter [Caballeronia sp. LZ033]|uniref:DMT family transporter n=1 Tax=Caballeronia sp. LZ033 TaxID=3038566 RepID=UPI0028629AE0|nr:DMT family transporter [Caballeronia sp. LZ033]MDR5815866.1 DMT family transporter [Caballeronia sp. LZ033]
MNTNPQIHSPMASFAKPSGAVPFVFGCVLLGTIGLFVHEAHAAPLTATWFRCVFGLAGLTLWLALRGQTRFLRLGRRTGPWVLTAGSLMVLSWGLFFTAIEHIPTGMAIVLFHVQPVWVLALGALCLGERVGRRRAGAVAVAMIGLVLATGVIGHGVDGEGYWLAVASCLLGAFCMACVTIIARRLRDLPAGTLAWWQCAIGTLTLWIWPMQHGWPVWGASWLWLAGLGVIHTSLAYSLMYSGMARLHTGRIAVLQFVYPAVGIVVDWLLLDQRLGSVQLAGVVLMLIAIGLAEQKRRRLSN